MVGDGVQGPGGGDRGRGRRSRKASRRAAPGLQIVERDGFWHVHGTVRVAALDGSRRSRRLRKGTGLPAIAETLADAETLRDTWALEVRQEAIYGRQPSRPVSIALEGWLNRPRKHGRKASWREVSMAQSIGKRFKIRLVGDVSAAEWTSFVEAETQARLDQVEERLARTRIEAPFAGVLVSGDLSQAIGGPVEQGKTLFELAPLDGYRVVLKVDERDIRALAPGQHGTLVLAGMAQERLPFTVRQISVAAVEEGQNLFRVEAALDAPEQRLRPGMEGVGKVEAGAHPLLWIWSHRFVDWLRLNVWRYLP